MNWDAYAEHYDEMCAMNPAYAANIQLLVDRLKDWALPESARICDLGAGTGNYILRLAALLPSARFWHVDFDDRMIELARNKYEKEQLANVHMLQQEVHSVDFPPDSFDLIVCINALYAFTPQRQVLAKMHTWLRPTGKLFTIDFGRRQRTLDWALYLLRESVKSHQVRRYARGLVEAREVTKQNRRTSKGQQTGRYWMHSTQEFGEALADAGFTVRELSRCYRDYADMAVCEK